MSPTICPSNSFIFNSSICLCFPGLYLTQNSTCRNFDAPAGDIVSVISGVEPNGPTFLNSVLPVDALKRLTEPQEEIIGTALVTLFLWFVFCFVVRFQKLKDGDSIWFKVRWRISQLDTCFATSHWVEELRAVRKRKTELGGTFSVASWILFIGLFSALLYQVFTRRSIEVHRVRPINAPDLLAFVNDMEFNITTVSSMTCAHLHYIAHLKIGMPGSIYFKVVPLTKYLNYTCHNTSSGPMLSLKCIKCKVPNGNHYISWKFIDLPNNPAYAVGFQFNLTAKSHGDDDHLSYVSGTLKPGNNENDIPQTFRGKDMNILKIHLFPQKFDYLHNLRLIQPLLHDFVPGSSFSNVDEMKKSFLNPNDGFLNTTLHIGYLSDYIVEIDRQKVVGIVSFLAQVGGIYTISIAVFLFFMLQCEARFKELRYEDKRLREIRRHRRAQKNWDKVRKYVHYTWGRSNLNVKPSSNKGCSCLSSDCLC